MALLNNYEFQFEGRLTSAGTTVDISPDLERGQTVTFTNAYIVVKNKKGNKIERMYGSASSGVLTLSLRGLDQSETNTEVSALKLDRAKGSIAYVTILSVQLVDKTQNNTYAAGTTQTFSDINFTGTSTVGLKAKSLTTTQRNAASNIANGTIIYNSTAGEFQIYQGGAWSTMSSGSTQPDASTTVAGKVEEGTEAEGLAGTSTGGTGAKLFLTPETLAKIIQAGAWLYAGASATGNDTYVVSMTPALTAYATGMRIIFKTDVANTGACTININSLGAKSIKLIDGTDPLDGDLPASSLIMLSYDGTNMVYDNTLLRASNATADTGTDTKKVITPAQLRTFAGPAPIAGTTFVAANNTTTGSTSSTSYVQKYTGTITRTGTYTCTFGIARNSAGTAYGRIYKDGVAFGTERTSTSNAPTYTSFNEDLAFSAGETVELWLKTSSGSDASNCNGFNLTYTTQLFTITNV